MEYINHVDVAPEIFRDKLKNKHKRHSMNKKILTLLTTLFFPSAHYGLYGHLDFASTSPDEFIL